MRLNGLDEGIGIVAFVCNDCQRRDVVYQLMAALDVGDGVVQPLVQEAQARVRHVPKRAARDPLDRIDRLGSLYVRYSYDPLGRRIGRNGPGPVKINWLRDRTDGSNVVAVIPGSDPQLRGQYVAIGAHNDHVGFNTPVDKDSLKAFNDIRNRLLLANNMVALRAEQLPEHEDEGHETRDRDEEDEDARVLGQEVGAGRDGGHLGNSR